MKPHEFDVRIKLEDSRFCDECPCCVNDGEGDLGPRYWCKCFDLPLPYPADLESGAYTSDRLPQCVEKYGE